VCCRHGAKFKRCRSEGCKNLAKCGGVCIRHGASRKLCSSEGCTSLARKGGVCRRHRSDDSAIKDVLIKSSMLEDKNLQLGVRSGK
jgi:hypothetical protein